MVNYLTDSLCNRCCNDLSVFTATEQQFKDKEHLPDCSIILFVASGFNKFYEA